MKQTNSMIEVTLQKSDTNLEVGHHVNFVKQTSNPADLDNVLCPIDSQKLNIVIGLATLAVGVLVAVVLGWQYGALLGAAVVCKVLFMRLESRKAAEGERSTVTNQYLIG